MPPKSKGQTIQLRDLQRMVYESGQLMDNILPSQSQGLERTDSYSSNKRGGDFAGNTGGIGKAGHDRYNSVDEKVLYEVENTDWRKGRDSACDLPSANYGKSNYTRNKESRYKSEMEDILENTNWRSDVGRTSSTNSGSDRHKYDCDREADLDFRREPISRTNSRSNNPDLSPSSNYNWRDATTSNQESSFGPGGGRFGRENSYSSSKPIIDDRPDYLKNRFRKVVDSSSQDSSSGGANPPPHTNSAKTQTQQKPADDSFSVPASIDRYENLTKKLAQTQSQALKSEKKNKNSNANAGAASAPRKSNLQKDCKKREGPEFDLACWTVKTERNILAFEKDLWVCITGEDPVEKMTPKSSFSPGTFSPPEEGRVVDFISRIESTFDASDLSTLTLVAKLSHVVTIINLIERNVAGKDLAELYVLIETQRMAFAIGNPKVDSVTGLVEGLWLALLKTRVIRKQTFNSWLNKTGSLAEESKMGRKNALFELTAFFDWLNQDEEGPLEDGEGSEDEF
ncbi:hypothetical protein FG386_002715 [Cryptosporidium ryanae]|uniref:uncharacterized protein n=1 Tax=Cryptosporidium ryanae TaxID=515981 RepID=UPI00351A2102|nr:hypothetical protein FG386_002715 [Cryptosporidium ryanae]